MIYMIKKKKNLSLVGLAEKYSKPTSNRWEELFSRVVFSDDDSDCDNNEYN